MTLGFLEDINFKLHMQYTKTNKILNCIAIVKIKPFDEP